MKFWRTIFALVSMLGAGSALLWPRIARPQQSQRVPTIEEYNPKSTLVTKEHKPERAKFPFIDIHSHHWNPTPEHVAQLVKEMDNHQPARAGQPERGQRRRAAQNCGPLTHNFLRADVATIQFLVEVCLTVSLRLAVSAQLF